MNFKTIFSNQNININEYLNLEMFNSHLRRLNENKDYTILYQNDKELIIIFRNNVKIIKN